MYSTFLDKQPCYDSPVQGEETSSIPMLHKDEQDYSDNVVWIILGWISLTANELRR